MLGRFMFEPCHMDEVEFHAPPRESKSKRWLSFHPFSGIYIYIYHTPTRTHTDIYVQRSNPPPPRPWSWSAIVMSPSPPCGVVGVWYCPPPPPWCFGVCVLRGRGYCMYGKNIYIYICIRPCHPPSPPPRGVVGV